MEPKLGDAFQAGSRTGIREAVDKWFRQVESW